MNIKSIIISVILISVLSSSEVFSQLSLQWVKYTNGSSDTSDEEARSLCIDNNFNVNIAGSGAGNVYKILKYDTFGTLRWNFYYPGGAANKIIFNGNDNYFISGSNGLLKLTSLGKLSLIRSGNIADIILGKDNKIYSSGDSSNQIILTQKYDLNGSLIWSKVYGAPYYRYFFNYLFQGVDNKVNVMGRYATFTIGFLTQGPVNLSYDTLGNLTYSGSSPNTCIKGAGNYFSNYNFFTGYLDQSPWHNKLLLYKANSMNTILDTTYYTGLGNGRNEPFDIVCDNNGNVYIACKSWGVAVDYDFVVLKFNSSGDFVWEYRYNGSENSYDAATKIKTDSSGNIYASGTVTLNAHGIQIYTVKLSPAGELLWSDKFSRYDSANDSNYVNDLQVDTDGNVYVCGKSRSSSTGKYDFMTLKYLNSTVSVNNENVIIKDFNILQNYPNPFNPETNFKFTLSKQSNLIINIYSIDGKQLTQLVNSNFSPGEYIVKWDAGSFPSGVYFVSFESDNFKEIRKAVLNK